MIEPWRLEVRMAVQVDQIIDEACREARRWKMHRTRGIDYVPPLFVDAELPIVPRIAPPRIRDAKR
jgi:hypothetical protein